MNTFGQTPQNTGTLFGQTPMGGTPAGGIFGQQPQTGGGMFGQQQPQGGGMFGQQQQQPGQQQPLLGQQQPQQGQQQPQLGQQPLLGMGQQQPQQQPMLGQFGQQQQPAQQLQMGGQATQPPSLERYLLQLSSLKQKSNKHFDNLIKAYQLKEQFDKNQVQMSAIEKNALSIISDPRQQQTRQDFPLEQQIRENDRKTYTGKTLKAFNDWKRDHEKTLRMQKEVLGHLTALNNDLDQQKGDEFSDLEDDCLPSQIQRVKTEIDMIVSRVGETVKMQDSVLGLDKLESECSGWDLGVKNLSECLMLLDQQTQEAEDVLTQLENHSKVRRN